MNLFKRILLDESGQGATEYMVLLAAVIAVLIGVAWRFQTGFGDGVDQLGSNVKINLSAGFTDASGGGE